MRIYLASPLGFAETTLPFMTTIEGRPRDLGFDLFNPWRSSLGAEVCEAKLIENGKDRIFRLRQLNEEIARSNEAEIRDCDLVVAALDGVDVDSGTASEIGFAYALGKRILGLRTDFRLTGDNEASVINLQAQYWIEASGGEIANSIRQMEDLATREIGRTEEG